MTNSRFKLQSSMIWTSTVDHNNVETQFTESLKAKTIAKLTRMVSADYKFVEWQLSLTHSRYFSQFGR